MKAKYQLSALCLAGSSRNSQSSRGRQMIRNTLLGIALFLPYAPAVWAQCAPGIPGAGNPGCIPPTQPNSPYNAGGDGSVAPSPAQGPAPEWVETWGAVAQDNATGQAGTVENTDSRSEAERLAIETCKQHGGGRCEVLMTFHNQCAAFTQPKDGGALNWDTGASSRIAEDRALAACKGGSTCEVIYSKCSVPRRIH